MASIRCGERLQRPPAVLPADRPAQLARVGVPRRAAIASRTCAADSRIAGSSNSKYSAIRSSWPFIPSASGRGRGIHSSPPLGAPRSARGAGARPSSRSAALPGRTSTATGGRRPSSSHAATPADALTVLGPQVQRGAGRAIASRVHRRASCSRSTGSPGMSAPSRQYGRRSDAPGRSAANARSRRWSGGGRSAASGSRGVGQRAQWRAPAAIGAARRGRAASAGGRPSAAIGRTAPAGARRDAGTAEHELQDALVERAAARRAGCRARARPAASSAAARRGHRAPVRILEHRQGERRTSAGARPCSNAVRAEAALNRRSRLEAGAEDQHIPLERAQPEQRRADARTDATTPVAAARPAGARRPAVPVSAGRRWPVERLRETADRASRHQRRGAERSRWPAGAVTRSPPPGVKPPPASGVSWLWAPSTSTRSGKVPVGRPVGIGKLNVAEGPVRPPAADRSGSRMSPM